MKNTGKTVTSILVSLLIIACLCGVYFSSLNTAKAAMAHPAHTYTFDGPSYTDAYIVLIDRDSGNLVNAATGESIASTTWAEAKIDSDRHPQSYLWVAQFPRLAIGPRYIMRKIDGYASAAKTQTVDKTLYYDPVKRQSSINPTD